MDLRSWVRGRCHREAHEVDGMTLIDELHFCCAKVEVDGEHSTCAESGTWIVRESMNGAAIATNIGQAFAIRRDHAITSRGPE